MDGAEIGGDTMRITAACPEGMISDANNLAMVLGFGPDDRRTYTALKWRDADGNRYAAASFEARDEWLPGAQAALARPGWDAEPYTVNMAGARRAQAALVFWAPEAGGPVPQADPAGLTAIGGLDGLAALTAMGLVWIDEEAAPFAPADGDRR